MAGIQMIPLVAYTVGGLAALAFAFAAGIKVRGDHEAAKQLTLERGWHEAYKQDVVRNKGIAEKVGAALRAETAARTDAVARLRSELAVSRRSGTVRLATCPDRPAAETDVAVVSADVVGGGDRFVLSDDFRLRYDTALSLVVPASDRAGWVASAGAAAGPADLWTVLDAHTENAGRWAQCREMMTAAQAWFRTMGWVR